MKQPESLDVGTYMDVVRKRSLYMKQEGLLMHEEIINIVTAEVVEQVIDIVKDKIYKIYLYGSYARGDFTNESDIDIMIILDCSKEEVKAYRKQISILASRIGLKNDIEVSLLLRDKTSFENNQKILPFYQNIILEGVTLYG